MYADIVALAGIRDCSPGCCGWAQVNGRNTITWEQKFEYDVYYVDNVSFCFDMKILWLTLLKVIKREGINAKDGGFTEPFGKIMENT